MVALMRPLSAVYNKRGLMSYSSTIRPFVPVESVLALLDRYTRTCSNHKHTRVRVVEVRRGTLSCPEFTCCTSKRVKALELLYKTIAEKAEASESMWLYEE